jgi:two-component system, OmpR family, sensor histidine kinase VicK
MLQILKQIAIDRGVKVRILIPANQHIAKTIEDTKSRLPEIDLRSIDKSLQTHMTILLVDKRQSIIVELKDDTREAPDPIGIAAYSKSTSIASSYIAIFESLWRQTDMYEQLQIHDKMRQEFINIVAHELRTPIMPILGGIELLEMITRNANRLQKLAEDIVEVADIERGSFEIEVKNGMDLCSMMPNVISAMEKKYESDGKMISISFDSKNNIPNHDLLIACDADKIIQVLFHLLDNAMKFTEKGKVMVSMRKMCGNVIVSIVDTGRGIDPSIKNTLFEKFVSKSEDNGTGLGLYLSKKIIEAHGGKIWAENNIINDNNINARHRSNVWEATFTFSLPLYSSPDK